MPTYTFEELEAQFPAFLRTLFQTWKHVKSATLYKHHEPYIAEIVIQSELPKSHTNNEIEYFTSSIYIQDNGDLYLKGADYFDEVETWLRKIYKTRQPT
jgi:hypothetical protein